VSRTRRAFLSAAAAGGAALYLGAPRVPHPPKDAPNILMVVVDTLRVDHVYGPRAHTPVMDALAAEGLSFTDVYPEAMPTVPVRNSILTGRRMFPFRDWHDYRGLISAPGWEPIKDTTETFTSFLRRQGWWTGYVTDNPFLGWAQPYEGLRRSFNLFTRHGGQIGGRDVPVPAAQLNHWVPPYLRAVDKTERVRLYIANSDYDHDERRSFAAKVFTSGIDALSVAARHRPFALVVDTYEPHEPWTPPRRYSRLYGDPDYRGPEPAMLFYGRVKDWLPPDEQDLVLDRLGVMYAAEVTMTDHWLGALLDRLHELNLERETILVLVGDHGIQLGDHGWTGKISAALHPELIHVPLVIVHPERLRAGERTSYHASTHDLALTVMSMAGVRTHDRFGGVDLSLLFNGGAPPERDIVYGGYSDHHFVRTDRWVYMSDNALKRPKLFDLSSDPGEAHDVAAEHPDVVDELHETIVDRVGGEIPSYT
jgi:arylsulfatase A-like enzyme